MGLVSLIHLFSSFLVVGSMENGKPPRWRFYALSLSVLNWHGRETERCQRRRLECFFFLFLSFFLSRFQDDNAYGEISNHARRKEGLSVSFFFSYKKSFSSSSPLFIFRVAEFKSDFGDNPVEFMLGPLWWSRYSEYEYIYITSLMYTGLVWMATDKR